MQSNSVIFSNKASDLLDKYQLSLKDKNKNNFHCYLLKFYELLESYISEEVFIQLEKLRSECENQYEAEALDKDINDLKVYLGIGEYSGVSSSLGDRLKSISISIKDIHFPKDDNLIYVTSETKEVLYRLGRIDFINCKFDSSRLSTNDNMYFELCDFIKDIYITPFYKNGFGEKYRYISCNFHNNVYLSASDDNKQELCNVFFECDFLKDVDIQNLNFKKNLFSFPDVLDSIKKKSALVALSTSNSEFLRIRNCHSFNKLIISNCSFETDLKINGFDDKYFNEVEMHDYKYKAGSSNIKELKIIDTNFKSKLEIKNKNIDIFNFENSNVTKIFDLFGSRFIQAKFDKCIFSDFAGFEDVNFGNEVEKDNEKFLTVFKYVTFMDFSSFRGVKFNSGLDFSKTNLKDTPNFLNVYISPINTNRETFRIIKNSFDDAGNKIEANRFFIEEMKAYRRELKIKGGEWFNRFILFFNRWASNFGGNYILPIIWLVISVVIYSEIIDWHNRFFVENEYFWNRDFNTLSVRANSIAESFLPFSRFLQGREGLEFTSLLFYILFVILTWQTIVAVKRHTQR
ncbi:hypothetical protein [Psychrobacter sp. P11G3]|uniref:hypothetical protein n=1 Tax=Psychrobacter sp. P11G3 TaxID=1699623 RepID=UPI00070CA689|nr:hypothetical protein [Psychrobacter sp. P11G3]KRG33049.1 hypothetical protein AK824_11370 [Psychrobacter sp. P11G3]